MSFHALLICDTPFPYTVLLYMQQLTITDNDLIEKSNLNRQFLFRPHHIQVWIYVLIWVGQFWVGQFWVGKIYDSRAIACIVHSKITDTDRLQMIHTHAPYTEDLIAFTVINSCL